MPCFVHPKFQDAGPIRQLWGQSPYTHIVILSDTESGTSGGVWRSPMRERKPLGGIPVRAKKPLICRGFASVREITDRQGSGGLEWMRPMRSPLTTSAQHSGAGRCPRYGALSRQALAQRHARYVAEFLPAVDARRTPEDSQHDVGRDPAAGLPGGLHGTYGITSRGHVEDANPVPMAQRSQRSQDRKRARVNAGTRNPQRSARPASSALLASVATSGRIITSGPDRGYSEPHTPETFELPPRQKTRPAQKPRRTRSRAELRAAAQRKREAGAPPTGQ